MTPSKNPNPTKKKKTVQYSDEDLKKALHDIREKGKGIRETCRVYRIPRTTIQDRLSGKRRDAIETKGPDPVLGVEGEKQIKDWLLSIAKCGFPVKKQELLDTVQKIVKDHGTKNPFKDDRPGQTWYLSFLKRHTDLSYRTAEGINKARARVTEESIRTWFNELESFLRDTNNQDILECPERIFNGDESGFSMCPKTGKVLAPKGYRNLYQVKSGNEKDNLTVLVTFNANAQVSPPLVVFPYIRPPRAVVESMPEEWCLGKSESGWMRSDVFFEYVTNDFNNWVDRNSIKKPILLLVDGHRSHMSLVLSAMCEKLGIILYALPPNTTHMLQPADVSVFAPLKSSWKAIVRKFLSKPENINSCVNKTNFCQLFRDTLEDTNMNANIKNGFRKCGLYPFNPDAVDYTKCVQNSLENVRKGPMSKSKEITNEDLASTRKTLRHLKPILKQKKINVAVIFKELRKLKTQKGKQETDSEDITDSSVNQSISFQMEYSTDGVSVTDPSLPILTNVSDVLPCTNDENRVEEITSDIEQSVAESHTISVTAEIHSDSQPISHKMTHPEVAVVTHVQEMDSNKLISQPVVSRRINDTFDEILPYPAEEPTINTSHNATANDTFSKLNLTEIADVTHDQAIELNKLIPQSVISHDTFDEILPYPAEIITLDTSQNQKIDDTNNTLSTFHLTGTGVDSYLEIGSLVSLDDVVVIPTQSVAVSETDAFSKHLFIPEPPQRAKPKQTKTPAAISSGAWRKFYENKENLKAEKQAATLKRKQERSQVTKQKKIKKDTKPKTRNRTGKNKKSNNNDILKQMCTECDDILVSDAEDDEEKNIGCDFCQRWFHLKCTIFIGLPYTDVMDKPFICNVCIADQN